MSRIIDLFAGAGGLSEGFRRNGFDIVAHVEMDKDASMTLKTREAYYYCKNNNKMDLYIDYITKNITREMFYSKIPNEVFNKVINKEISDSTIDSIFNDIDAMMGDNKVDGIIGGPPCQAYSIAGRSRKKEEMDKDPRNYLYLQYMKFLEKYKPKFFVFENVEGILSAKKGTIFEDIKKRMKNLGYNIDYRLLDSADFGVVQHRKRIIIIGFLNNLNISYPIFEKKEYVYSIRELFDDLPIINSNECNNLYRTKSTECLKKLNIRDDSWNTLTYNNSRKLNSNDSLIYKMYLEKPKLKYNELPHNLIKHNNKEAFLDRFKVVEFDKACHTIVAHISKDGHHYIHPDINQLRSLTVREAARIQSFPDDYYFECCNTSAFKQIGNAVPVFMAEQISKKIKELIDN